MRLINFTILTSLIALLHNPHCEAGFGQSKIAEPEENSGSAAHTVSRNQALTDDLSDIPHVPTSREIILYNETKFNGINIAYPKSAEFTPSGHTLIASVKEAFELYYFPATQPDKLDSSFTAGFKAPSNASSLGLCINTIYEDLDELSKVIGKENEIREAKSTIDRLIEVYKIADLPREKVKLQRTAATGESRLRLELDNDTIVIFSVCARPSDESGDSN